MKEPKHPPYAELRWVSPNGNCRIVEMLDQDKWTEFRYGVEWQSSDSLGRTKWISIPLSNLKTSKKAVGKALIDILEAAISTRPFSNKRYHHHGPLVADYPPQKEDEDD